MDESATHPPCKLVRQGKGPELWGECACGQWAWLGTYEMPKGRLAKLRAAHAEHVTYVERTCGGCHFDRERCACDRPTPEADDNPGTVCPACTYPYFGEACTNPCCVANPALSDDLKAQRHEAAVAEEAARSERMRLWSRSIRGGP